MCALPRVPPVPAVLRLVQTAVLGRWRATGEELYREVARITEAGPGKELLVAGSGGGITAEWLAQRTGAAVTGVDPVPQSVQVAEARARSLPASLTLHYQQGALDDLPHENEVFDASIGEPALSAAESAERAVSELARVTKPMGAVVLLQPSWTSELSAEARELVVERLGLRPHLLVEWKQMLRDAGVVEILVQDWTSGAPGGRSPTPSEAAALPKLSWREKVQITGRAFRQWGWREARNAVEREAALLRELARERSVGFVLIKGVKWPHAKAS
jgi:SAM-dependent methyltransferase